MMNYIYHDNKLRYPSSENYFSPDKGYPEYLYIDNDKTKVPNLVYDAIRNLFINLKLDEENIGKRCWNPLGEYISPGMKVLIKPNFVMHKNGSDNPEDMDSLVTHPSIIRCIIDYALIALKGKGELIVADAPVKDCDFSLLMKNGKYDLLKEFYEKNSADIIPQFIDLRGPEEEGGQYLQKGSGVLVNLGDKSFFYDDVKDYNKYRIPNYDYHKVVAHHHGNVQEYMINSIVLDADVIISLPKPKTHRKNGFTGALKNFVGANYSKEYLPHHTSGAIKDGGDEYKEDNIFKKEQSKLRDKVDILRTKIDLINKRRFEADGIVRYCYEIKYRLMRRQQHKKWIKFGEFAKKDDQLSKERKVGLDYMAREGSWHGNDTLWRTVLDLNLAVEYANKQGIICDSRQRKIIYLGDMIVSGEKDGPMAPTPKSVKTLLFSDNPVEFDCVLVKIMGFDWNKFKSLVYGLNSSLLSENKYDDILICSNVDQYVGNLCDIDINVCSPFVAGNGWIGHIEIEERMYE